MERSGARRRRGQVLAVVVVVYVVGTVVARALGYRVGGNAVVRCREGHLFTTIWIPGVSVKSLRLGWFRWQYCPVGRHWVFVRPVKEAMLSDTDRAFAEQHRDIRIP
jgi:hypothetical protein